MTNRNRHPKCMACQGVVVYANGQWLSPTPFTELCSNHFNRYLVSTLAGMEPLPGRVTLIEEDKA